MQSVDVQRHKVALLGPLGTGKTALLTRFSKNTFSDDYQPTVGAGFISHEAQSSTGPVSLNIWDTAGQERFRCLVPRYSRGSSALVLVFDLSNRASFEEARTILDTERSNYDTTAIWYLVGNKSDIDSNCNADEIGRFATELGLHFFRTSAKTGENVHSLFTAIAEGVSAKVAPSAQIPVEMTRRPCC
jgi:small GTP-binding protein